MKLISKKHVRCYTKHLPTQVKYLTYFVKLISKKDVISLTKHFTKKYNVQNTLLKPFNINSNLRTQKNKILNVMASAYIQDLDKKINLFYILHFSTTNPYYRKFQLLTDFHSRVLKILSTAQTELVPKIKLEQ